jgi:hypothetical protein
MSSPLNPDELVWKKAAVAAKGDDLARAVQRLDAVGLTERRSDGSVIE